jgi:hypothetical protein
MTCCACPLPFSGIPEAMMEVPSRKSTVPVGITPVLEATVAVNVTGVPVSAVFEDHTNVVFVEAGLTVETTGGAEEEESEPEKFASPLYVAVILWEPALRLTVSIALPPFSWADPIVTPASLKVTDPVGVILEPVVANPVLLTARPADPALALTTAVKVTGAPNVDVLVEAETVTVVEACAIP